MTCLSDIPREGEESGRLSMWRNYSGGQTGVGIIVKTDLFQAEGDRGNLFGTPVFYYDDRQLNDRLLATANTIRQNSDFLKNEVEPELLFWNYLALLRSIAISTKHPGFSEERELRIFHTHGVDPSGGLPIEIEVVAGVPQRVIKFRLKENGLTHADVIARLLIGPSAHQRVIATALNDLLIENGVRLQDGDIRFSPIPLRVS